ncbi:rRNA methyltransferase 3, mitochondrial [Anoplophora glabripennis]|nr:rRNA methyltransferase 3, mitochondrial [Anoplophora glabripennis]
MSTLLPYFIRRFVPLQSQQIRYLPRWSHRRPVRAIPAEEYDEAKDIQIRKPLIKTAEKEQNTKINWNQSRINSLKSENETISEKPPHKTKTGKKTKPLSISKVTKSKSNKEAIDMLETIIDQDGNFVYTKMKNNDSRISSILVEVKSKKEKDKRDLILLEGKRLIKDALDAGCKLKYILFSRIDEVQFIKPFLPKLGAKLYKMPYREMQLWSDLATNPGIMGIFKIPDTESFKSTDIIPLTVICDNIREPNNLGAVLRTCSGVGCENVILTKGCVNVWDTKVLRSASGAHFKLHITRRLGWSDVKEELPPDSMIYIADNRKVSTVSDDNSEVQNLEETVQSVPVLPYYGVDFGTARHIVLIIGGETEGISAESYELAAELQGVRLNVPLSNEVDSLNTGTALGVIAFEIKRQLLKSQDEGHDYISSKY